MQIFDYLNKEGLLHLIRKIMGRDVDLTQAEYDALPESKNSDGKNYYIYDSDIAVTAEEVGFDGSASGSTAANSQQALDELFAADKKTNESLENINSNLVFNNIYKHRDLGTITSSNRDEWIAKHINSDGTFNNIYVGDVVTIQDGVYNAVWVVADLKGEAVG